MTSVLPANNDNRLNDIYSGGKKWIFKSAVVSNVLPPDLQGFDGYANEKCVLFEGDVLVEELFSKLQKSDNLPRYQIRLVKSIRMKFVFSSTDVIDSLDKLMEVIKDNNNFYRIKVKCQSLTIILELTFKDQTEKRNFNDMLFRISEEYSILTDMPW